MGDIRVLPDHLANQIAAGEVVERPVAALKELVENSLDAGADRIHVTLESGGKKRIRVVDNGTGMDPDDCLMALERHATSKLTRAEDLFSIQTLGFRGEALPSIASVSHFSLESVAQGNSSGLRVEVHGGKLTKTEEIGGEPGTKITVDNLFYNIPARRKFLRTVDTELSWMVNLMTQYSFAHIDKTFILEHDGRKLFEVYPVSELKERIYQHFGKTMLPHLLPVSCEADWLQVSGLVSTPDYFKTSKTHQFLFINGRLVKDKVLSHALADAYRGFGEGNRYPAAFLFVQVPSEEVDVNVHPAKTEVRFIHANFVHDQVRDAIRRQLLAKPLTVNYRFRDGYHASPSGAEPGDSRFQTARQEVIPPVAEQMGPLFDRGDRYQKFVESNRALLEAEPQPRTEPATVTNQAPAKPELPPDPEPLISRETWQAVPRVIGQFRESYILAEQDGALLLIDQHVLHERLLYDQIKAALANDSVERQVLLLPETLELSPAQAVEFEKILPVVRRFGFDLDPFDGNSFLLREVPAFLEHGDLRSMVDEIIEKAQGQREETAIEALIDLFAATKACKAAIKINMSLTREKMEHLVDRLWASSSPLFCPHGRPVVLKFTNEEIEKNFLRR